MITEESVMTMTFGSIQEQIYKFVIFAVLLEHRSTNFTLLAITFAGKEQMYFSPKLSPKKFSVYLFYKVYFRRKTNDNTGKQR